VTALKKAFEHVRRFALSYPETREDHPWGESALKVKGKTFVFMGLSEGKLGLSVKLPRSREFALDYPFTRPTGYGLGQAGWVSASFAGKDNPPLDVLRAWVDESFRAIAPRKLVATLPDAAARSSGASQRAKKKPTKKKPAAKKPAAKKRKAVRRRKTQETT
jgi:predicted DNA-binding protein (MmcQ/YjbR family)